jgi:phage gp36-like protein
MYATRADLSARFGAQELARLEDPDNTGTASVLVSDTAISDASEEVDSYLGVRYTKPLPSIPAPLKRATCDIARFRLYKDRPTEEVTYRYERSIKWLEQLAVGKVILTFDPALSVDEAETLSKPVTPQAAHYAGGAFGDDILGGMVEAQRSGYFGARLL